MAAASKTTAPAHGPTDSKCPSRKALRKSAHCAAAATALKPTHAKRYPARNKLDETYGAPCTTRRRMIDACVSTIGATDGIIIPAIITTHIVNVTPNRAPQHGKRRAPSDGASLGTII